MGGSKRLLEKHESEDRVAAEILMRARVIRECKGGHEILEEDSGNVQDAYMLGNALISADDKLVEVFEGDRRAMTDAVKRVNDNTMYECAICEKERNS